MTVEVGVKALKRFHGLHCEFRVIVFIAVDGWASEYFLQPSERPVVQHAIEGRQVAGVQWLHCVNEKQHGRNLQCVGEQQDVTQGDVCLCAVGDVLHEGLRVIPLLSFADVLREPFECQVPFLAI